MINIAEAQAILADAGVMITDVEGAELEVGMVQAEGVNPKAKLLIGADLLEVDIVNKDYQATVDLMTIGLANNRLRLTNEDLSSLGFLGMHYNLQSRRKEVANYARTAGHKTNSLLGKYGIFHTEKVSGRVGYVFGY